MIHVVELNYVVVKLPLLHIYPVYTYTCTPLSSTCSCMCAYAYMYMPTSLLLFSATLYRYYEYEIHLQCPLTLKQCRRECCNILPAPCDTVHFRVSCTSAVAAYICTLLLLFYSTLTHFWLAQSHLGVQAYTFKHCNCIHMHIYASHGELRMFSTAKRCSLHYHHTHNAVNVYTFVHV